MHYLFIVNLFFTAVVYVVTGVYKGRDVMVMVTKKDSLDETGLEFIEDAVTILKWALTGYKWFSPFCTDVDCDS